MRNFCCLGRRVSNEPYKAHAGSLECLTDALTLLASGDAHRRVAWPLCCHGKTPDVFRRPAENVAGYLGAEAGG